MRSSDEWDALPFVENERKATRGSTSRKIFALLAASFTASAQEQTVCGIDIKEQAAKDYAALDGLPDDKKADGYKALYEKYKFCADDAKAISPNDNEGLRNMVRKPSVVGDQRRMACRIQEGSA